MLATSTIEDSLPFRAELRRGIFASVARKSACAADLRVAPGSRPVFLPRARTYGLLAFLQLAICFAGLTNFWGRSRLLRRKMRNQVGQHDPASDTGSYAQYCRPSAENCLGRLGAEESCTFWFVASMEGFCPRCRTGVTRDCMSILNSEHNQGPFRFPGNAEFLTVANSDRCTSHRSKPEVPGYLCCAGDFPAGHLGLPDLLEEKCPSK